MEKLSTGISGLDEVLQGGIRRTSSVLLAGTPGTGKTLFGMHYIYAGAKKGEAGLIISYEELESSIVGNAQSFGFDFTTFIKKGLITVTHQRITGKLTTFRELIDLIKKRNIQRVFLDSITLFEYAIVDPSTNFSKEILGFVNSMKEIGVTLLATTEKAKSNIDNIEYTPQEFLFEGLIYLAKVRKGASFERCITVAKLRGQPHLLGIYPFSIGDKCIEVYPKQIPFSLVEND